MIGAIGNSAGRLDGLVNAAGIAIVGTVEDTDFATWRRVMAINLDGTFLGCKYAMPLMKKTGGSIVNLSSVSGLVGGYNLAAYNASKGGVRLLSKSVALHGARLKPQVRCNSVHPTFIEGPMTDALLKAVPKPDETRARMEKAIPLGRFGHDHRGRRHVRVSVVGRVRVRHRRGVRDRWRPDGAVILSVIASRTFLAMMRSSTIGCPGISS